MRKAQSPASVRTGPCVYGHLTKVFYSCEKGVSTVSSLTGHYAELAASKRAVDSISVPVLHFNTWRRLSIKAAVFPRAVHCLYDRFYAMLPLLASLADQEE